VAEAEQYTQLLLLLLDQRLRGEHPKDCSKSDHHHQKQQQRNGEQQQNRQQQQGL